MKKYLSLVISLIFVSSLLHGCVTGSVAAEEDIIFLQVAGPFYTSATGFSSRQERIFLKERERTVSDIVSAVKKASDELFDASDGFEKYEDNLIGYLKKSKVNPGHETALDDILKGIASYRSLFIAYEEEIRTYEKAKPANGAVEAMLDYNMMESSIDMFLLQKRYLSWLKTATAGASHIISRNNERRADRLISSSADIFKKKIYPALSDANEYLEKSLELYDVLTSMDYHASSIYLDLAGENLEHVKTDSGRTVVDTETLRLLEDAIETGKGSIPVPENLKPVLEPTEALTFFRKVGAEESPGYGFSSLSESLKQYREDAGTRTDSGQDSPKESFQRDIDEMAKGMAEAGSLGDRISTAFAIPISADDIATDVRQVNRDRNIRMIQVGQTIIRGIRFLSTDRAYAAAISRISALIAGGENISEEAAQNAITLVETELNNIIGENRDAFLSVLLDQSAQTVYETFEEWRDGIGDLNRHEITRGDLEAFLALLGYDVKTESVNVEVPVSSPHASQLPTRTPASTPSPSAGPTGTPSPPNGLSDSHFDVFHIAATYDTMINLSNGLSNENLLYIIYGWSDPLDYSTLSKEEKHGSDGSLIGWRYLASSGKPVGWDVSIYGENAEYVYRFPDELPCTMKVIRKGNLDESIFYQVETVDENSGRKTAIRLNEDPEFPGDSITYIYEKENGVKDGLNTTRYNSDPTYEVFVDGSIYESYTFKNGNMIRKVTTAYEASTPIDHIIMFYEDGTLRSERYENDGLEYGLYTSYNKDGVLVHSIEYTDGKYDGEFKFFFDDGTLREFRTYSMGLLNGPVEKYHSSDGHPLEYRGSYSEDEKDGRWETFTRDGQPDLIMTYSMGALDGEYKSFATGSVPSESIHSFGQYSSGKRAGEWLFGYNNEGWVEKVYYENGVKVWMEKADGNVRTYYDADGSVSRTESIN